MSQCRRSRCNCPLRTVFQNLLSIIDVCDWERGQLELERKVGLRFRGGGYRWQRRKGERPLKRGEGNGSKTVSGRFQKPCCVVVGVEPFN